METASVNNKQDANSKPLRAWYRSAPLIGSLAGIIIILAIVIEAAESVSSVVGVALGILLLEVSIWYAANPIFTNRRQYQALSDELDRLVDSVRQLNRMATSLHDEAEIQRINDEMHASVDTMVKMAGSGALRNEDATTGVGFGSQREKQTATSS